MTRLAFLAHRYLGIALGSIVLVWCLSGIVMMYVQYPALTPEDEVRRLDALDLRQCCTLPHAAALGGPPSRVRVEMLDGRPVLRAWHGRTPSYWDLRTGERLGRLDTTEALAVAERFAANAGITDFRPTGLKVRDQWTVYGAYDPYRPLYKFAGADAAATQWYVSSRTGEVVQATTGHERFWNWLGAVPHWLYPTVLRQHTWLWSQIVIWLTIFGTFLTLLGVYIGLRQYKSRRSGRYSPYRGASLWHHYAGLVFGVFTLLWLVSGFFSMTPWGTLEGRSFAAERANLRGGDLRIDQAFGDTLSALAHDKLPKDTVRLDAHMLGGEPFLVAWSRDGARERLAIGHAKAKHAAEPLVVAASRALRPSVAIRDATWLRIADSYYYDHHDLRRFPVYRIIYEDGERIYLDPLTAEIVYAVDTDRKLYRWLHYGLHRGDFAFMRARPLWDAVMVTLLVGVTLGVATGVLIGLRRVARWRARAI